MEISACRKRRLTSGFAAILRRRGSSCSTADLRRVRIAHGTARCGPSRWTGLLLCMIHLISGRRRIFEWGYPNQHKFPDAGRHSHGPVSSTQSSQLGNPAGFVPVGDIDIGVLVEKASMRGAERCGGDGARIDIVLCPLVFAGVVAQERYRHIVAIENRCTSFQLGNHRVVAEKAYLAGPPQMGGYGAHEFSIEIKM